MAHQHKIGHSVPYVAEINQKPFNICIKSDVRILVKIKAIKLI